ncbi:MAG: DUF4231 domain-containing protein [Leptospirales bacterium]
MEAGKKQTKKIKKKKTENDIKNIDEKKYLSDRLEHQLDWYSKKASYYKGFYHRVRFVEILCASTIPFVAALQFTHSHWVAGGLGVVIAIAAGANSLYKSQENWVLYRTTAENLIREKFMYLTKTGPYSKLDRFHALVHRIEALISTENSSWGSHNIQKDETSEEMGDGEALS